MKLVLKKYFVPILSLMLILSNFSFAANLAVCGMMENGKSKCCCGNNGSDVKGIAYSKEKKSCCDSRTMELSNSTNQINLKNEFLCDAKCGGMSICELKSDLSQQYVLEILFNKQKLPEDIPILISSLLI